MNGNRVFLIEDEALILKSYSTVLEKNGYEIAGCAYTGTQALEKIPVSCPDLLLMDINLPDANGIELLRKINETRFIPCVFVTAYYSEELIQTANQAGAFGYILKPVQEKQLLAAVNIARSRAVEFDILRDEAANLKTALQERKLVERAKGILMKQNKIDEEAAMRLLQQKSKNMNKKLILVAKQIIAANELLNG